MATTLPTSKAQARARLGSRPAYNNAATTKMRIARRSKVMLVQTSPVLRSTPQRSGGANLRGLLASESLIDPLRRAVRRDDDQQDDNCAQRQRNEEFTLQIPHSIILDLSGGAEVPNNKRSCAPPDRCLY